MTSKEDEPMDLTGGETDGGVKTTTTSSSTTTKTKTTAAVGILKKKKKKKKALTWDEHAIEEHDQLRGTRMKIDEPDTPYNYSFDHHGQSDEESTHSARGNNNTNDLAMNWDRLENKLGAVAAVRDMYPSSPSASSVEGGGMVGGSGSGLSDSDGGGSGGDGSFNKRREKSKKAEFKMHRKAHYNEMEAVKRWRAAHTDNDDDDDDDENVEKGEDEIGL